MRIFNKSYFHICLLLAMSLLFVACANTKVDRWRKPASHPKAAIIGLDGATWEIIDELTAQNKLPNLKHLIETGVRADYMSIEPILSPLIWTTMVTGVTPERHGITWFMVRDPQTGNPLPITSAKREVRALWNIASDAKKTVGFIGWWASWPAEKVNGFIVSDQLGWHGFGMSAKKGEETSARTYPENLYDDLKGDIVEPLTQPKTEIDRFMKITDAEYSSSAGKTFSFYNPIHYFMYTLATLKTYEAIGLKLYSKNKPDLLGIYFESIDTASHLFMKCRPPQLAKISDELFSKYQGTMDAVYIRNDEMLGRFLKVLDPGTTIFICSDHGFKVGDDREALLEDESVANAHKWHKIKGVLIINGPNVRQGYKLLKSSVVDLTPTVLYALGLPTAKDFDGKVLSEAFTQKYVASHPVKTIPTYQTGFKSQAMPALPKGVSKEMEEKLKSLGYLGGGETAKGRVESMDAVETHFNRLDMYRQKGDMKKALDEAQAIIRLDDADPRSWASLGETLAGLGRENEALDAIQKAEHLIEKYRTDPPRLASGALKYPKANDKLLSVLSGARAVILMQQNHFQEAEKYFKKAQKLDPKNVMAFYNYALMLESDKRSGESFKAYLDCVERFPKHPWALNNLGNIYFRRGELKKAIELYDKAADSDPEHHECRHNKGVALLKLGRIGEAEESFKKTLEIKQDFVPSLVKLGMLYSSEKKYKEAKDLLLKADQLSINDPQVLSELADLYFLTGDIQAAKENIEKLRILDPESAYSLLSRHPELGK